MLSAVLRSPRAVQMSIFIIRAFIRLREIVAHNKDIAARVEKLERGHDRTSSVLEVLVEDIDRLAREVKAMKALPPARKLKIGFFTAENSSPPAAMSRRRRARGTPWRARTFGSP